MYRDINLVADVLSKCSLEGELGVQFMEQPPPQIVNLLDDLCDSPRFKTSFCFASFLCLLLGFWPPYDIYIKKKYG